MPTPSPDPPTRFECPNANEEACATGRQCFRSKLKCDGGQPDCADGSDESTLVCNGLLAQGDEEKDDGSGTAVMWGIIGTLVACGCIGACGILACLHINGGSRKTDDVDEDVKTYSRTFANLAYAKDAADGELYGIAGPSSASTGPDNGGGDQSYVEIGAAGGGAYANVVDGDDGGYAPTSATGAPSGTGVYDMDFAATGPPTRTVGSTRRDLGITLCNMTLNFL